MTGASRTQTVEIVNSIQLAIAETKIPNVTVNFGAERRIAVERKP